MKRLMIVAAALTVGYFAADMSRAGIAQAQAPAPAAGAQGGRGPAAPLNPRAATNLFLVRGTPETKMQPGKAVHWTREQQAEAKSHIQWDPLFRLTASVRGPAVPGKPLPSSGENHSDNTQIYLITGGSGTVLVEGKVDPANDYLVAGGEHRGGPIVGGREIKVKVGDLVSLPPDTWHIAWGDPGVELHYLIIGIHTRQTIP